MTELGFHLMILSTLLPKSQSTAGIRCEARARSDDERDFTRDLVPKFPTIYSPK